MKRSIVTRTGLWFTAFAILAVVSMVTAGTVATKVVDNAETQRAISSAKDLSTAFRVASRDVLESVVAIEVRPKAMVMKSQGKMPRNPMGQENPFKGTPFEDFFGDDLAKRFEGMRPDSPRSQGGLGSGVIIDASGIILTNNHVVAGDGEVTVRLHDGREYKATDVKTDPQTDLAIVRIEGANHLHAASLGNSDNVEIGDWVLALGQPFGLEKTVTAGIISAKHRGIGITDRENFIQTDAAINPGNSGGPLINLDGEVVGINTAISSRSGGNEGIGFAIPVNMAKWVSDQLVAEGLVQRAMLGVGIQQMTQTLAHKFDLLPGQGVLISDVHAGTPAEKAGLKSGDVIVKLNGKSIGTPRELQVAVERCELDKPQKLMVLRDGKEETIEFTPVAQSKESKSSESSMVDSKLDSEYGIECDNLSDEVARQLGLESAQGVVITNVQQGSAADLAGLAPGMVITQVDRKDIKNVKEFVEAMQADEDGKGVLLLVRTENGSHFLVLER